jgi:tRNA threonylcarbamoyladenosine biosynthesis protein TsaB
MKTLYLEASTSILYVSFYDGDVKLYEFLGIGKNDHSENLINTVKAGLDECGLKMKDFERVVVGIGPGSYTGLRVALTVAKMFAWTLKIPLYKASSLDFLASGYFNQDGIYAVSSRAKNGYVYGKVLEIKDGKPREILPDSFLTTEDFQAKASLPGSFLVNADNYRIDPLNLDITLVEDLYGVTPNYLRGEL